MKKRILAYRKKIDRLLEEDGENTDWSNVMKEHLVQIGFFQHERLVHLIVTCLVAIITIIILRIAFTSSLIFIWGAVLLLMVLLVAYILHYYTLENEVQKMYEQYDAIQNKIRKNG